MLAPSNFKAMLMPGSFFTEICVSGMTRPLVSGGGGGAELLSGLPP